MADNSKKSKINDYYANKYKYDTANQKQPGRNIKKSIWNTNNRLNLLKNDSLLNDELQIQNDYSQENIDEYNSMQLFNSIQPSFKRPYQNKSLAM